MSRLHSLTQALAGATSIAGMPSGKPYCYGREVMRWRLSMPNDAYIDLLRDSLDVQFAEGIDLRKAFEAFDYITVHLPGGGTLTIERDRGQEKPSVEGPGAGSGSGVSGSSETSGR